MKILRAAWIAPMNRPPIANGAVAFDAGRIVFAGTWPDAHAQFGDASVEDLGDAIILPGLVNPHTHLELSSCNTSDGPTSFVDWVDWVLNLAGQTRTTDDEHARSFFAAAVNHGVRDCLRFGVTSVGDISQRCDITRPLLSRGPLRVVSYGEALGIGVNRPRFDERLARAADARWESDRLHTGISPHATYSVDRHGFESALLLARSLRLPLATHLAEHPYEAEFLERHQGPLRTLLDRIGAWSDEIETYPAPPIQFAHAIGLLDYPALLAHANYCDDAELALLARGRASVVYCPRTHRYFGHSPHRWREMLATGVNVAVGTDSRASSPDLDLVEDLRLLHAIAPEVPALTLWQMATSRAALAIEHERNVGTLELGKAADFAIFEIERGGDPLRAILECASIPRSVFIAGELIGFNADHC